MLQRTGRVLKKLSGREGRWNVSGGMGLCGEAVGEGMGVVDLRGAEGAGPQSGVLVG